jgi:acetyl-CoA carboxylase biotin carboxyl carrier protein
MTSLLNRLSCVSDFSLYGSKTALIQERMRCMHVIASPMAGTVSRLLVQVGEMITPGQDVVILESMKMEIAIQADAGGRVRTINVSEGAFVDEGAALIDVE